MCCEKLPFVGNTQCLDKKAAAKENGKRFCYRQPGSFCRIRVDGCLIKDSGEKRCDYAYYLCLSKTLLLVELKGTDVATAVFQILSTKDFFGKSKCEIESYKGVIVSSSVPAATETQFRKLQAIALRDNNVMITKHHNNCDY